MLEQIDKALWLAEGEAVRFYGLAYPTRSVIVRLACDQLWVWSPVGLTEKLRADIKRLGTVTHLVSPNKLHHLHLAQWKSAYPAAKLWGPLSTITRCRELEFAGALGGRAPTEWGGDIEQAWFCGSFAMDEIVFFHRRSRTAIVADLIQAFDPAFLAHDWPWWARPLARLDGISAADPGAPREWRLSFFNRTPARSALATMLSWRSERVVIAHGAWARSDGQAFLERAFAWV